MEEHEDLSLQPESSEPVPEPEQQVDDIPPVDLIEEELVKPPRRLRKILLWTVGLVVLFAAGVVLSWFVQVRPQTVRINDLETQVQDAQDQIDLLDQEVQELRPLSAKNAELLEALDATRVHLDLLSVLVDVTTAQLALTQEDDIAAQAALTGTDARLVSLESTLEGANADVVRDMSERLELVVEEVESDPFAARRDLEILANNLLALERVLFE